jgi:hypothetical protein
MVFAFIPSVVLAAGALFGSTASPASAGTPANCL